MNSETNRTTSETTSEPRPAERSLLRRIVKWVSVLALLIVLLLAAVLLWGWYLLRASLAQLDGKRTLTGLAASVQVERDSLGVPTIRATNRVDAARALGFVHAQERFFQMDLLRRLGAGELAELLGPAVIDQDRWTRRHQFRQRARKALENARGGVSAEETAVLQAYADGVNAGLKALRAVPPEYLLLRAKPQPWLPEDSLLVAYAMFFGLQDSNGSEDRNTAIMREVIPAGAHAFFMPQGSSWDAAIDDSTFPQAPVPPASVIDFRTWTNPPPSPRRASAIDDGRAPVRGSNNWAVDGRVSAAGGAIVANDMHLDLRVPIYWFRVRLVFRDSLVGDQDLIGLSLPGAPVISVGSNRHVAWGFTNAFLDTTDLVRLELDPASPLRYRTPEGWKEMEIVGEEIRVRGGTNIFLNVTNTIWGPLVTTPGLTGVHALCWVAHSVESLGSRLIEMERARSVKAVLEMAPAIGTPLNNLVVADKEGNIGYTLIGRLPRRVGFDGSVPESWADGSRCWNGLLPQPDYPRLFNPPSGRIWTANNRVMGSPEYMKAHPVTPDEGARARQIRDDLRRLDQVNETDLFGIYKDDRALFLERWQKLMLQTVTQGIGSHTNWGEVRRALESWGGRASPESVGYRLARAFRLRVRDLVFEPLANRLREHKVGWTPWPWLCETPLWSILEQRPPHLLNPHFASYDELLVTAVSEVLKSLEKQQVSVAAATWGRRNRFHMRHHLSPGLPDKLARWLDMPPVEMPGDEDMPRVQGPDFGVTERLVVSPGREESALFNLPGGQSGHFLSPFYRAGHEFWLRADPAPLLPGPAQHHLTLIAK